MQGNRNGGKIKVQTQTEQANTPSANSPSYSKGLVSKRKIIPNMTRRNVSWMQECVDGARGFGASLFLGMLSPPSLRPYQTEQSLPLRHAEPQHFGVRVTQSRQQPESRAPAGCSAAEVDFVGAGDSLAKAFPKIPTLAVLPPRS